MLTRDTWDECQRLLAQGKTQREIRAATGLARRTIGRIHRGEIPRPAKCRGCKPKRPKRGRCETCGAMVDVPCCGCCPEMHSRPGSTNQVVEEDRTPLKLALRGGDRERLHEVKAEQVSQRQRVDPSSLNPEP